MTQSRGWARDLLAKQTQLNQNKVFFSRQNSTAITTSRTTWDASALLPATCHQCFT